MLSVDMGDAAFLDFSLLDEIEKETGNPFLGPSAIANASHGAPGRVAATNANSTTISGSHHGKPGELGASSAGFFSSVLTPDQSQQPAAHVPSTPAYGSQVTPLVQGLSHIHVNQSRLTPLASPALPPTSVSALVNVSGSDLLSRGPSPVGDANPIWLLNAESDAMGHASFGHGMPLQSRSVDQAIGHHGSLFHNMSSHSMPTIAPATFMGMLQDQAAGFQPSPQHTMLGLLEETARRTQELTDQLARHHHQLQQHQHQQQVFQHAQAQAQAHALHHAQQQLQQHALQQQQQQQHMFPPTQQHPPHTQQPPMHMFQSPAPHVLQQSQSQAQQHTPSPQMITHAQAQAQAHAQQHQNLHPQQQNQQQQSQQQPPRSHSAEDTLTAAKSTSSPGKSTSTGATKRSTGGRKRTSSRKLASTASQPLHSGAKVTPVASLANITSPGASVSEPSTGKGGKQATTPKVHGVEEPVARVGSMPSASSVTSEKAAAANPGASPMVDMATASASNAFPSSRSGSSNPPSSSNMVATATASVNSALSAGRSVPANPAASATGATAGPVAPTTHFARSASTPSVQTPFTPMQTPMFTPVLHPSPMLTPAMSPMLPPSMVDLGPTTPVIKPKLSDSATVPPLELKSNYQTMLEGQGHALGFSQDLVKMVEDKRNTHKYSEKKRRDDLKSSFLELRALIPSAITEKEAQDNTYSKSSIIKKAISYVSYLQSERSNLAVEVERLRAENARLRGDKSDDTGTSPTRSSPGTSAASQCTPDRPAVAKQPSNSATPTRERARSPDRDHSDHSMGEGE